MGGERGGAVATGDHALVGGRRVAPSRERAVPRAAGVLQRCGGVRCPPGTCNHDDRSALARSATGGGPTVVPPIVREVLQSSGRPLDRGTRGFFEDRLGHDFSRVRVHTDGRAARSAEAVHAQAYTVGREVVFGAGQFEPGTRQGRELIAHELTHVVQQDGFTGMPERIGSVSDPLEREADVSAGSLARAGPSPAAPARAGSGGPVLQRRVAARLTHCPPNTNGAPADPVAELTANDTRAGEVSIRVSESLADDAAAAAAGVPDAPSQTFISYRAHLGLPIARAGGFLNRLTGVVRPSLGVAMSEELRILSRRFAFAARTYTDFMNYVCVAGAGVRFGACESGSCEEGVAWSCAGTDVVFLCPGFWNEFDAAERAGVLIHEAMHVVLESIGDDPLRGPGGNFGIAGCYESIANELVGVAPADDCPAPP